MDINSPQRRPYKLTVVVHYAENLPIADITQSDPYVVVTLGEKVFLRTHTIYRNRSHPSWEKKMSQSLLHMYDNLEIEVFDENQNNHDVLMGSTMIDLTTLPYNQENENFYNLLTPEGKQGGKICISIVKHKFKSFVQVLPYTSCPTPSALSPKSSKTPKSFDMRSMSSLSISSSQFYQTWIEKQTNMKRLEGPLRDTLHHSSLLSMHVGFINHGLLPDILSDVHLLLKSDDKVDTDNFTIRSNYVNVSSTNMDIHTFRCTRSAPMKRLSLNFIHSSTSDEPYKTLAFPNRHILWTWMKWLKVAYQYWRQEISETELPQWVLENDRQLVHAHLKLVIGDRSKMYKGRHILSLDVPYMILCKDASTGLIQYQLDLTDVITIRMSLDTPTPYLGRLEIQALSAHLNNHDMKKFYNTSGKELSIIVKSSVNTTMTIPQIKLNALDELNNETPRGVPSISASSSTNTNGYTIGNTAGGSTHPLVDFDTKNSFVEFDIQDNDNREMLTMSFHHPSHHHSHRHSIDSDDDNDFRKSLRTLVHHHDSTRQLNKVGSSSTHTLYHGGHEMNIYTTGGFHIFLRSKDKNSIHLPNQSSNPSPPTLIAHKYIPYEDLLQETHMNELKRMKESFEDKSEAVYDSAIPMDRLDCTHIYIKLVHATIAWPSLASGSKFSIHCSAVDWRGRRVKSVTGMDSPSFNVKPNIDFNQFEFQIPFNGNWNRVEYIKLKLYYTHLLTKDRCGTLLIPLEDFFNHNKGNEPIEHKYALEQLLTKIHKRKTNEHFVDGSISVSLRYYAETPVHSATGVPKGPSVMNMRYKLGINTTNKISWSAEASLANNINVKECIEKCRMSANYDGIDIVLSDVSRESGDMNEAEDDDYDEDEEEDDKDDATEEDASSRGGSSRRPSGASTLNTIPMLNPLTPIFEGIRGRSNSNPVDMLEHVNETPRDFTITSTSALSETDTSILSPGGETRSLTDSPTREHTMDRPLPSTSTSATAATASSTKKKKSSSLWCCGCGSNESVAQSVVEYNPETTRRPSKTSNNSNTRETQRRSIRRVMDDLISGVGGSTQDLTHRRESLVEKTRKHTYEKHRDAVLTTCQERTNINDHKIHISWDKVLSVDEITSSILSISIRVNRYLGEDKHMDAEVFKPVIIQVFVLNCPAKDLHNLLNERMMFYSYRQDVKNHTDPIALYKELDEDATQLEERAHQIENTYITKTNQIAYMRTSESFDLFGLMKTSKSDLILYRARACRLRMYIATLIHRYSGLKPMTSHHRDSLLDYANNNNNNGNGNFPNNTDTTIAVRKNNSFMLRTSIHARRQSDMNDTTTSTTSTAAAVVVVDWEAVGHERIEAIFTQARKIQEENMILTINHQVEFLIEEATSIIIDCILRGWNSRESSLPSYLATILNEFLIELTGLVSRLFEDNTVIRSLKGLQSKIKLISTFAKCNDAIDDLTRRSLVPYNLIIEPHAKLLLFLNFDMMLDWYASILQQEMSVTVQEVLAYWSDRSKDASGLATKYNTPLPWIPMRKFESSGVFMTHIPEDIRHKLDLYLEYARLKKEDVALSLHTSLSKLDDKLYISFAEAFVTLSDKYWQAVTKCTKGNSGLKKSTNRSYSNLSDLDNKSTDLNKSNHGNTGVVNKEDEWIERVEWLCSVVSDTQRITDGSMNLSFQDSQHQNTETNYTIAAILDQIYSSYHLTYLRAIEKITACMFKLVCTEGDWLNPDVHMKWIPVLIGKDLHVHVHAAANSTNTLYTSVNSTSSNHSDLTTKSTNGIKNSSSATPVVPVGLVSKKTTFDESVVEIYYWLENRQDYLEPLAYHHLVISALNKIILRYLHMLKVASLQDRKIESDSIEMTCIMAHFDGIKNRFSSLMVDEKLVQYLDALKTSFSYRLMDVIVTLMNTIIHSEDLDKSLKVLESHAQTHPKDAYALSNLAMCVLSLRAEDGVHFQSPKLKSEKQIKMNGSASSSSVHASDSKYNLASSSLDVSDHGALYSAHSEDGINIPSNKSQLTSTVTTTSTVYKEPKKSTMSRFSSLFHSKRDKVLDPVTSKRIDEIMSTLTTIKSYYDDDNTQSETGIYHVFHPHQHATIVMLMSDEFKEKDSMTSKNVIEGLDPKRFGMDSSKQKLKITINNLVLTNIHGSYKFKPILVLKFNNQEYRTGIAAADPSTDQYLWRDYFLDIPVDHTLLSSQPLICELHYKGRLYGTDKIGSTEISLSKLHVSNIQDEMYPFISVADQQTATGNQSSNDPSFNSSNNTPQTLHDDFDSMSSVSVSASTKLKASTALPKLLISIIVGIVDDHIDDSNAF